MMALMLRQEIYLFDVCLLGVVCLNVCAGFSFLRSQAGAPPKIIACSLAIPPREFSLKFLDPKPCAELQPRSMQR
jgi:hypothetical protein